MPNLNETLKIRTEVDNSLADQGLNQLQKKVQNTTGRLTKDFSDAGKKAGDQMGREIESRMNKSMRLVGQTFNRYFGEWGRMFGDVFQMGKDVSEILPRRRGQSGGHGGSMAGVIGADVGSDAAQIGATYGGHAGTQKVLSSKEFWDKYGNQVGPNAPVPINSAKPPLRIPNGNGVGAAGLGIGGAGAAGGVAAMGGAGLLASTGIGLAIGAGIGLLGYYITKQIETNKQIKEMGKEFNLTTQEAKRFYDVGQAIGDEGAITKYLTNLTTLLEKAKQGSKEAASALKELGVASSFVSTGAANEQILQAIKNASTQLQKDVIALKAGMSLALADKETGANPNWNRNIQVQEQIGSSKFYGPVNRLMEGPAYDENTRQLLADQKLVEERKIADGLKAQAKAAEALNELYESQVTDADEKLDLLKYDLESLQRKFNATTDLVEIEELRVQIAKKQIEIDKATLESTNKFLEMIDAENEKIAKDKADKEATNAFLKDIDEVNKENNAKGKYLIDRKGMNATAYGATTYNTATKAFTGTDENMVVKSLMGKHKNAVGDPTKFNIAGNRQSKLDNYMKRQGFMDMPMDNTEGLRYIPLGNGKFLPVSQAMRSHTDNIRGTKNLNEPGINPISLLEIMNRNGGALPTKVIIQ